MKKLKKIFYCNVALLLLVLLLVGCAGGKNEEAKNPSDNDSASQSEENNDETEDNNQIGKDESESTTGSKEAITKNSNENSSKEAKEAKDSNENSSKESVTKDSNENSSKESSTDESNENSSEKGETKEKDQEDNALSKYPSEKIEYARVWLQLGPNQEIDELNVRHISAGEPINPNDDTSASYPEDVIQLAGSRLVDGSVTYSGNGDGTINVYNVPLRWDSSADVNKNFMQKYTKNIIENKKLVHVDPGVEEKIIKLIDIMNIH
ncbi:hypothetical protein [Bacillus mojavensis]|jgi:hypothetical protein|uniref:hypothetical protein n=1 Tax=Bacillus mojavensis TaxID=72360 RepID=UPI002DB62547|nr:hypothetical protein [Bacillus mojavensis]MEC1666712.1 hypothetical protein [Bacillus mojavensis]MEC1751140.1 hypothetical protein [Bacillus mojavensis]